MEAAVARAHGDVLRGARSGALCSTCGADMADACSLYSVDCRLQTADCKLQAANCKLQTAASTLQTLPQDVHPYRPGLQS